jgi:membrane protein DedA with SNARE-associated domain
MNNLLVTIVVYLEELSGKLPLPLFAFLGSILEELISPIPSPFVMVLTGSLVSSAGNHAGYLFLLALLGAIGKTIGCYLVYLIADKSENIVLSKWGKFFGISQKGIESIGARLSGDWKDDVLLFFFRTVPLLPSTLISITCGVLKLNLRTYLITTFAGSYLRSLAFLYLGYSSVYALDSVSKGVESIEKVGWILIIIAVVVGGILFLRRKYSPDDKNNP